jgi:hypothetical protein
MACKGSGVQIPSAPLISAGQTVLSPSLRRLTARRFAYRATALRYPDAGHLAGGLIVYLPSVTDDALTTSGGTLAGTQAAQADAHGRLIGRASSAWWWPGMKLLANGPYLLPYLLSGALVAVLRRRSLDHRGGGAHEGVGMLDLRGVGSLRDDHWQATRR